MKKFDLSRRQFVNASLAAIGLYGITGTSNFILADEPKPAELDEVTKFLTGGKTHLPYITITDDGPDVPADRDPLAQRFHVGRRPRQATGGPAHVPLRPHPRRPRPAAA